MGGTNLDSPAAEVKRIRDILDSGAEEQVIKKVQGKKSFAELKYD